MKERGYRVRVEKNRVSVEHRASFRPRTIFLLGIAYLGYCLLPAVRKTLIDFYNSHDPVVAGFALFMLLIPFFCGVTWLIFASGEVMSCDAQELRFARRRTWGRWHRFRFSSGKVQRLRWDFRRRSKGRCYTVLSFQHEGQRFDMLEEINQTDSNHILEACKSLGLDVFMPVNDAAAMLKDIEERGWFVNPWRADQDENHPAAR